MEGPRSRLTSGLIVFVLLFMRIQISQAACSNGWFGTDCKKQCHCAGNDECNAEGECPHKCQSTYYGPACQVFDAMQAYGTDLNNEVLLDQDMSTCVNSTTSVAVQWNISIQFTTARLEFSPDTDGTSWTVFSADITSPTVHRFPDVKGSLTCATPATEHHPVKEPDLPRLSKTSFINCRLRLQINSLKMSPAFVFSLAFLSILVASAQCSDGEPCIYKPEIDKEVKNCIGQVDYSIPPYWDRCMDMIDKFDCAFRFKDCVGDFEEMYGFTDLYNYIAVDCNDMDY